jgi:hypothetical protein
VAREDFFESVNILELNDYLSSKCIFSIRFGFVTSNTNSGKFESRASNKLFGQIVSRTPFYFIQCISTAGSEKSRHFPRGYILSSVAKNLQGQAPVSL